MKPNVRAMPQSGVVESPSEFFVPTRDDKNPSVHVEFRIHPAYAREAAELYKPGIEAGATWKTQDDCERWVWKCGLEAAAAKLKVQPIGATSAFDLFIRETELELEVAYARDRISKIRHLIEERQRIGVPRRDIEDYLRTAWRSINSIKYPRWRSYLLREFERDLGHMMSTKAGLTLEDMEEER